MCHHGRGGVAPELRLRGTRDKRSRPLAARVRLSGRPAAPTRSSAASAYSGRWPAREALAGSWIDGTPRRRSQWGGVGWGGGGGAVRGRPSGLLGRGCSRSLPSPPVSVTTQRRRPRLLLLPLCRAAPLRVTATRPASRSAAPGPASTRRIRVCRAGRSSGRSLATARTAFAAKAMSERVRHDSVSTVAFKFQAHHLFHIFKFDVQEFRLGTT